MDHAVQSEGSSMGRNLTGMSCAWLGFAFTLTGAEQSIRVATAAVGLAIGVVTLIAAIRKLKSRER